MWFSELWSVRFRGYVEGGAQGKWGSVESGEVDNCDTGGRDGTRSRYGTSRIIHLYHNFGNLEPKTERYRYTLVQFVAIQTATGQWSKQLA
eukprot:3056346-Rhodomonas_salina.2